MKEGPKPTDSKGKKPSASHSGRGKKDTSSTQSGDVPPQKPLSQLEIALYIFRGYVFPVLQKGFDVALLGATSMLCFYLERIIGRLFLSPFFNGIAVTTALTNFFIPVAGIFALTTLARSVLPIYKSFRPSKKEIAFLANGLGFFVASHFLYYGLLEAGTSLAYVNAATFLLTTGWYSAYEAVGYLPSLAHKLKDQLKQRFFPDELPDNKPDPSPDKSPEPDNDLNSPSRDEEPSSDESSSEEALRQSSQLSEALTEELKKHLAQKSTHEQTRVQHDQPTSKPVTPMREQLETSSGQNIDRTSEPDSQQDVSASPAAINKS